MSPLGVPVPVVDPIDEACSSPKTGLGKGEGPGNDGALQTGRHAHQALYARRMPQLQSPVRIDGVLPSAWETPQTSPMTDTREFRHV